MKTLERALNEQYAKNFEYPTDATSLQRILWNNAIDLQPIKDPWGNSYVAAFSVDRDRDVVSLSTMGPDEKPHTPDDFTVMTVGFDYFRKIGEAIDRGVLQFHNETGSYIRDLPTLIAEVAKQGVELPLRDRWGRGNKITFNVSGRHYVLEIKSAGPDGVFSTERWQGDDITLWTNSIDYFVDSEREITRILNLHVNFLKKPFPQNEAEFAEILRQNGLNLAAVKDGDGRPVSVTATQEWKTSITPQGYYAFKIRGGGDRDMATFSAAITASMPNGSGTTEITTSPFSGAKGAISGTISDEIGAVVPGVSVRAIENKDNPQTFLTTANDDGYFLIANVPSGKYTIRTDAISGFSAYQMANVVVASHHLTDLKIVLYVTGVSAMVDVSSSAASIDQTSDTSYIDHS